jgi:hypothetical protein
MSFLATLGLGLDAIGALLVLAPRLQILMRQVDRFWWFQDIETAKAKLYREGHIDRDTPGFKHIAAAIEYGSNWTRLPGERLERGGKNEIHVRVGGESYHLEDEGYNLFEVERIESEDAYPMADGFTNRPPISQTIFTLKYRPRVTDEAEIPFLRRTSPYLAVQSPPGQLPKQIQDHKERMVFRLGASLLFVGFLLQLIPSFLSHLY